MDQVIRSPPISYPGVFFIHKRGRKNSHRECCSLAGSLVSGAATHTHAHFHMWADGQGKSAHGPGRVRHYCSANSRANRRDRCPGDGSRYEFHARERIEKEVIVPEDAPDAPGGKTYEIVSKLMRDQGLQGDPKEFIPGYYKKLHTVTALRLKPVSPEVAGPRSWLLG